MKKFSRRGGQATIEFVLILPIFAMLLFALIYVGFLFIDVVTLDGAAAAAARSAAMNNGEPSTAVKEQIKKTKLFLYWYKIKDGEEDNRLHLKRILSGDSEIDAKIFTYGIQAELTDKAKDNKVIKMFLPEKYTVTKTAYKE